MNPIVPGHEEGDREMLRHHAAGPLVETPAAIAETLHRASAQDAAGWKQWRMNLRNLARPSAARDLAARVLSHAHPAIDREPARA